jgi:hypothetical protein
MIADIVIKVGKGLFMAKTKKTENINENPNTWGFEALTVRLRNFVESLDSGKRKVYWFVWLGIAAVLIVASSLPLPDQLSLIRPIVGTPAGVIVFALGLSLVYGTSLGEWNIFNYKDNVIPKRRVTPVLVGLTLVAALLIVSASWMPIGVGGSIMVAAALTAYNVIRRTPYEIELAMKGIPDPREYEIEEAEEAAYYTDEEEYDDPENIERSEGK